MVYLSVIKEFRDEQEELLKEEQELSNKNVKNNKNGKQFHFSYKITPTKTIKFVSTLQGWWLFIESIF